MTSLTSLTGFEFPRSSFLVTLSSKWPLLPGKMRPLFGPTLQKPKENEGFQLRTLKNLRKIKVWGTRVGGPIFKKSKHWGSGTKSVKIDQKWLQNRPWAPSFSPETHFFQEKVRFGRKRRGPRPIVEPFLVDFDRFCPGTPMFVFVLKMPPSTLVP